MRGESFRGHALSRDIVVFTLHKSASMFIHRQCEWLCRLSDLPYHSPNMPSCGLNARMLLSEPDIWRTRSGCFAPLRFFVEIPQLERYEVLLHLRDPRDVLVSMFYSYCHIHAGEIPANTGYRRAAAERGIDAFVLAKSSADSARYPGDYGTGGHVEDLVGNVLTRYRTYIERLLRRPNVTLLKYEEMVADYPAWLEKFSRPFPLRDRRRVLDELVAQSATFFPHRATDSLSHVRHVAPGDHRLKLEPTTIERLDELYADVLDALGYSARVCA
jgi:hypothetical protein